MLQLFKLYFDINYRSKGIISNKNLNPRALRYSNIPFTTKNINQKISRFLLILNIKIEKIYKIFINIEFKIIPVAYIIG